MINPRPPKAFLAAFALSLAPCMTAPALPAQAGPVVEADDAVVRDDLALIGSRMQHLQRLGLTPTDALAVASAWAQNQADAILKRATSMIRDKPNDYQGYALRYVTQLRLARDPKAAHQTANLAAGALAKLPGQLVAFIERAMFVDATAAEYRIAVMALAPLVPDHARHAGVRVAHLRALVGAGKLKEAVITNKNIVEDLRQDPKGLLHLASAIVAMDDGRALGGVARKAIELAEAALPGHHQQELLKVKYRLLHDLLALHQEARKVGEQLVGTFPVEGGPLNDFVWSLMVDPPDAGRFPTLALLGARRLLTSESIEVNEWDTIALAFFRNGMVDEAIDYQRKALAMPGATAAYRTRMAMYEAAKAAAQAKAAQQQTGKDRRDD
jgi:tetratricopeptide (TPR) repeat protein